MAGEQKPDVTIQCATNYGYQSDVPSPVQREASQPPRCTTSSSVNYARLSMLVIDAGTEATATTVKKLLPDSHNLDTALSLNYGKLDRLLRDKVINQRQMDVLFPPSGLPVDENKLDLTLWVVILRNITKTKMKWVEDPQPWQRNFWHDIQRLKIIRNRLAHIRRAELSKQSFIATWNETETILLRLGVPRHEIQHYQERDLEPERARRAVQEVKSQFLDDLSGLFEQTKDRNHKLKILLAAIFILIGASVVVSVVVALKVNKPWSSCANHIKYANTGERVGKKLRHRFTPFFAGHVPCVYYKRFPRSLGTKVNYS